VKSRFPFFCAFCGWEMTWSDDMKVRSVHVINGSVNCPSKEEADAIIAQAKFEGEE
jgi:hypothetical protein